MRLAVGLAAAAALAVAGDERRDGGPPLLTAAAPLQLRVAPDGGAPIRATLPAGAAYQVTARQANWLRVRSGEQWGWTIDEHVESPAR